MGDGDDDDVLAEMVKRNKRAQISMGMVGIVAGLLIAMFGAVPPFGLIAGLALVAVGVVILLRGF